MSYDLTTVKDGFLFTLNIENGNDPKVINRLVSPKFFAEAIENTEWCMHLCSTSGTMPGFVLHLWRTDVGSGPGAILIDLAVSVETSLGSYKVWKKNEALSFKRNCCTTYFWYHDRTMSSRDRNLTIHCHIRTRGKETVPFTHSFVRFHPLFRVPIELRFASIWGLENFEHLPPNKKRSFTVGTSLEISPLIEMSGELSKKPSEFCITVCVKNLRQVDSLHLHGNISVLGVDGSLGFSLSGSSYVPKNLICHSWVFPVKLRKKDLIYKRDLYLPEGTLSLLCEFVVISGNMTAHGVTFGSELSSGHARPVKEFISYEGADKEASKTQRDLDANTSETKASRNASQDDYCKSPLETRQDKEINTSDERRHRGGNQFEQNLSNSIAASGNAFGTLLADLKNLYAEKKGCDVVLLSDTEAFSVHKNILCSRSPVFSAMFDSDMREAQLKEVEIADVDADTLNRFLLYVYSETLEELQWENATKLLYAASKYQVQSLMLECSSFLESHLSMSNICEALVLADLHQVRKLKSACQDFIAERASEVFTSEQWKAFSLNNALLSTEIIQHYFSLKK